MSKKAQTTNATPSLVELKLAVINFHKGDHLEYTRTGIARDACYTSHNSIKWKLEQMSKIKEDIATLAPTEDLSEVVQVQLAKKVDIYQSMEEELAELQERHDADLQVYHMITGEVWSAKPRRTGVADSNSVLEAVKAILA